MPEHQPTVLVLVSTASEHNAVRTHLEQLRELVHPDGIRVEKGLLPGTPWQVVIGDPEPGAGRADAVSALLVDWLRPEAVFSVGVAGGLSDEVAIGDVVVATGTYDLSGAMKAQSSEGVQVRPEVVPGSHLLERAARSAVQDMRGVRAHFGPIVRDDSPLIDPGPGLALVLSYLRDALAIDLQGFWPARAATPSRRPEVLAIRGIDDHIDALKDDALGAYHAAERAASVLAAVLRRYRPKAEGVPGRRYAILVGVSQYAAPSMNLPGVTDAVERLYEALAPMGYERVLTEVSSDPTSAQLRGGLQRWARTTRLGPDDIVFAYFAGHGAQHGGRQYLLGSDDDAEGFPYSAISSDDFSSLATDRLSGHSVVVFDICQSDPVSGDATVPDLAAASTRPSEGRTWVLTSSHGSRAESGVFTRALREVLDELLADRRQRFLSVPSVTEGVRERLRAHGTSGLLRTAGTATDGEDPFFPNPAYVPGLPPDELDLAGAARIRREHGEHFAALGRGVPHASVAGDLFVGRVTALTALTEWLSSPDADNESLAVTGAAGSGKSALLGRLVSLMNPDSAARLSLPPSVSPPNTALIALSCRTATPTDIVSRLAAALGLPAASDRYDVFAALGARTNPLVILLDGLDEAQDPRRIAADVIRPLSSVPGARLVIGTRRDELTSLGPALKVIDLDEPPYRDDDDLRVYARHLLDQANLPAPRRSARYAGDPARAAAEADDIARQARGSFLFAQLAALTLLNGGTTDTAPARFPAVEEVYESLFRQHVHDEGRASPSTRLLLPLAYAQGAGLPAELWAPLAAALTDEPCTEMGVQALLAQRNGIVTEDREHDTTVYRLFHQTFAEHLRTAGQDRERHRLIALALVQQVPVTPSGERDWGAAHPYIREHLVTHAAAGHVLDGLLTDAAFLRHAAPGPLLRALQDRADTGSAPSPSGPEASGPDPSGPSPAGDDGTAEDIASRLLAERPVVLVVATEWFSAHGGLSSFNRHLCTALAAAGAQVFCTVLELTDAESLDAEAKHVTLLRHPGAPGAPEYGRLTRRPLIPVTPHLVIGHGRITGPAAVHLQEDYFQNARRLHIIHMAPDEIEWHKLDAATDRAQLAEDRTEIERKLGTTAHRAFAVGPRLHGRFANELHEAALPPTQLDPGFDVQSGTRPAPRTPPPGLPLKVLLAGRTDEAVLKGVDLAALALGRVHELRAKASIDPVELLVRGAPLGKGDAQRDQIIDWSGVPALEVTVRGFSPDPGRLDQDMGCASLVIMPSRSEGFGMIGVEAIIRGVPVLVSGNSGLAQLLREELRGDADDLIVPVTRNLDEDAVVWAERINRCLTHRDAAFERIAKLRNRLAARVTWEAAASLILAEAPPRP
ncbi:caspase family protein [Streptomyces sp. TBY4]|uniref:caspase family protein n=1 Tax=Streptomyces sp. TBY4 TaxID=2962030 RepID=UPI0020B89275|nr:caspase family protein [Streptomyces sp. TBY4]MCP3758521.1 caspase family protein [Streptomyces sp. TBY4]